MSTAGSAATIGWAGPWVVTHKENGPDRMYPAKLRPKAQIECLPSYHSNVSAAKEAALVYAPVDHHTAGSSKQPAPQPVHVEWMLPGHVQAPVLAHASAAATAPRTSHDYQSKTTAASAAARAQGIPGAPAAGSPPGASWRVPGSQIPSPVRNVSQQQSQQRSLRRTTHDGDLVNASAGHPTFDGPAAQAADDEHGRGQRVRPPANNIPPFPNAAAVCCWLLIPACASVLEDAHASVRVCLWQLVFEGFPYPFSVQALFCTAFAQRLHSVVLHIQVNVCVLC